MASRFDIGPPTSSLWRDKNRVRSYEPLAGTHETDVVIVGAGITGLTLAYLLKKRGARVTVLERNSVGSGTTGGSTAKVSVLQGAVYRQLAHVHGRSVSSAYAAANLAGLDLLRRTVDDLGLGDELERRSAISYATTSEGRVIVEDEAREAGAAGLPVHLDESPELGYPALVGLRLDDQAQIDPVAYLNALAAAVDGDECVVHEHSPMDASPHWDGHEVSTVGGRVRASRVVLATGTPPTYRGLYFARTEPKRSYAAAISVERMPADKMTITVDEPTRSVRTSPGPEPSRRLVIVGGEGHVTGRRDDTIGAIAHLVQWADDHFGVAEVVHHWSAQDYQAADGLPFVGALWPLDGRCLVATGYGKWGFTNGSAAALVLADLIDGAKAPAWAEIYNPTRLGNVDSIRRTAEVNAGVAKHFAIDWAGAALRRSSPADRAREGQGCVIRDGVKQIAESCVDGRVRRVSAVCPHLGGVLRWNQLEQTWDCPLHGSRFDSDGRLLEGPTTSDLESFDEGLDAAAG